MKRILVLAVLLLITVPVAYAQEPRTVNLRFGDNAVPAGQDLPHKGG